MSSWYRGFLSPMGPCPGEGSRQPTLFSQPIIKIGPQSASTFFFLKKGVKNGQACVLVTHVLVTCQGVKGRDSCEDVCRFVIVRGEKVPQVCTLSSQPHTHP